MSSERGPLRGRSEEWGLGDYHPFNCPWRPDRGLDMPVYYSFDPFLFLGSNWTRSARLRVAWGDARCAIFFLFLRLLRSPDWFWNHLSTRTQVLALSDVRSRSFFGAVGQDGRTDWCGKSFAGVLRVTAGRFPLMPSKGSTPSV